MGRAIDHDNRLDELETRLKLVEGALEEMIQTRVHHVDLHEELEKHESDIRNTDEEFTPPAGRAKKKTKVRKVESML